MDSTAIFSGMRPLKLFFFASVPGAVSMLASALYQTIDGVLVGQFLGATAFAAINLAMPFVIINFSLADLIGVGAAVPIAICLGRKETGEACNIFTCACLMIVGTGFIIGGALFAAAPGLMELMGADGEFAALATQYLQVYAVCSPVTTIVFAADNFLRICGFIRGSMFLNLLMSVLSAILEFIFLGVFRWGVWGADDGSFRQRAVPLQYHVCHQMVLFRCSELYAGSGEACGCFVDIGVDGAVFPCHFDRRAVAAGSYGDMAQFPCDGASGGGVVPRHTAEAPQRAGQTGYGLILQEDICEVNC